jgi:ABC-2 type transport system ATP-binding protein
MTAIEARGLTKTYEGGVEAVKGIDLDIAAGEIFGLLGPNGAGKSTTIGMLTTTLAPTSGSAFLAGHDVEKEALSARRASSVVFQDAVVDRSFTGRRNLDVHARLWSVEPGKAIKRTAEVTEALGIANLLDRSVGTYSGGQRRRLEIARALISDPRVLFLDEPTVGLDPRIRHELLDVIEQLGADGEITILLTTHYLDEAERLCDRIAVMHEGRIVALGTPTELRASLGEELVEIRVDGEAAAALDALRARGAAGDDAFSVGSTVIVPLRDRRSDDTVALAHEAGVPVSAIITRRPTLDDVYLRLTGGRLGGAD